MCRECVDLVNKYFPKIRKKTAHNLLMGCTCFPFGKPEQLEVQLKAIAERRAEQGFCKDWLGREMAFADAEMGLRLKIKND